MLEENFISSMIKADGNLLAFFTRPIAATLGVLTIAIWFWPLLRRRRRRTVPRARVAAAAAPSRARHEPSRFPPHAHNGRMQRTPSIPATPGAASSSR